jgi:hypothetical protein
VGQDVKELVKSPLLDRPMPDVRIAAMLMAITTVKLPPQPRRERYLPGYGGRS